MENNEMKNDVANNAPDDIFKHKIDETKLEGIIIAENAIKHKISGSTFYH